MAASGLGGYGSVVMLGRDAEFRSMLDAISRAVHGRGYAVCVEGEPGIGKTALVDAVVTAAMTAHPTIQLVRGRRGVRVLAAPCRLLDLLTPVLDRVDDLPAGQRHALTSALGRSEASMGADRFLVAVATLALPAAHAEDRPLLLVIDDLHWIDPETSAAIAFSARRLRHDPIAILLTRRRLPGRDPGAELAGIRVLELAGLQHGRRHAIAGGVGSRVGCPTADLADRRQPTRPVGAGPLTRSRLIALLTIVSGWVSHGIVTTAFAFGAPVGPTLLHRRCLYLASTPERRVR